MENKINKNEFFINWNNWISILVTNISQDEFIETDICKNKENPFYKNLDNISTFRWRILSTSISIENLIDYCIEFIIFDEKNDKTELFQKIFLKSSHLTFFGKWNILKELCKESSKTKAFYNKEIISSIQDVIELRNNIAHWYSKYDYKENKFYIEYIKNHKLHKDEINDIYILNNTNKVYWCINEINKLIFWNDTTIKKKI